MALTTMIFAGTRTPGTAAAAVAADGDRERVARLLLGRLLEGLRGKVAVADVAAAVDREMQAKGDGR